MSRFVPISAGFFTLLAVAAIVYVTTGSAPSPADPDDHDLVAQGARIYARSCASCHGARGQGQEDWKQRTADGRFRAPPHDGTGHTWHHPDAVLFDVIANSRPDNPRSAMPAFGGTLSEREIWATIAYIKSLWPERARVRQAQQTMR